MSSFILFISPTKLDSILMKMQIAICCKLFYRMAVIFKNKIENRQEKPSKNPKNEKLSSLMNFQVLGIETPESSNE